MKTSFKLNINNPCAEKFEDFRPTQAGGFCQSCQKEVIDFTKMSDQELIDYFKSAPATTCGQFHTTQLRNYPTPSENKKRRLNWFGAGLLSLSIFSILPTGTVQAQKKPKTTKIEDTTVPQQTNQNQIQRVEGIVVDEYDAPLPGVNVVIKGTSLGTVTDVNGHFEISVQDTAVLIFKYIGYESHEIVVGNQQSIQVQLKESSTMLGGIVVIMGAVEVEKPHQSKRTIWQRIKAIFRKKH